MQRQNRKIEAFVNDVLANVAATILEQLGGNKFVAMTGCKNLVSSKSSLQFDLPGRTLKTKGGINKVMIELTSNDEYTIIGYKYAKLTLTKIQEMKNIQVNNLRTAFSNLTGLKTSL